VNLAGAAERLAGRHLYLCTGDRPDLEAFLMACLRGGVDLVQLREKHLDARSLVARARVAATCCREFGVPFVVNDRPDVALECGADGVHVGQEDVMPGTARRILGPGAIVGLSTHSPSELAASRTEPVDYPGGGPPGLRHRWRTAGDGARARGRRSPALRRRPLPHPIARP
jgi:thiamine-phosphate pyrophosphorylase